jgi:hypothetical protein
VFHILDPKPYRLIALLDQISHSLLEYSQT